MLEDFATRLAAIDRATLAPLLQQALDQPEVEVLNWGYGLLHGRFGREASGVYGIYRFSGNAETQAGTLPWSLILKASGEAENAPVAPSDWGYWKREALFYQSGLFDSLPVGLATPRCFAVVEPTTEEVWLWLEDIREVTGRVWPLARYGMAARHLGEFNGAYLAGRALPAQPWLMQGHWQAILREAAPYLSDLYAWRGPPMAQQILPPAVITRLAKLCEQREAFAQALNQSPRCFCHQDAHRRNLFARRTSDGNEQTVAIDWALSGVGALGEDAAKLLSGSLSFLEYPVAQAAVLDKTIFAGYLAGLQAAGWWGDPQVVRRGYTLAAVLMGLQQLWRDLAGIHNRALLPAVERIYGHPIGQILDQHAGLFRFTLDLADEALGLIAVV